MPLEYTADGTETNEAKAWNITLKKKDDLRLVCSTGGCDTVDNYAKCNLGEVPARLAVTWSDYPYQADLAKLLAAASTDKDTQEDLFEKVDNFWAELTNELVDVSGTDVLEYLGNKLPSYQRLYSDNWLVCLGCWGGREVVVYTRFGGLVMWVCTCGVCYSVDV